MILYYIMRGDVAAHKKKAGFNMKEYSYMITLDQKRGVEYCHDEIKFYKRKGTISEAKRNLKKFVKITGLDIGEIVTLNENCTVRCVYKFNGEKFLKEEVFK